MSFALHVPTEAVDLFADAYDALIDEPNVTPLRRTRPADAERLAEQVGRDAFGVVHLRHDANERRPANDPTPHCWDFHLDDATGHFVIRRAAGEPIDAASRGTSRSCREGRRVVFEFTKHAAPISPDARFAGV